MKKFKSNQTKSEIQPITEFDEIFSRIMNAASSAKHPTNPLKAACLDTSLGPMIAIADEDALYVLAFAEPQHIEVSIERLRKKLKSTILLGKNRIILMIEKELKEYFAGNLTEFKTPLFYIGTPFQKRVWDELQKIPYGETLSYADVAVAIGRPTAFRAVARANATNQITIIIPCHRVINSSGEIGGYGGGLHRKQWLLDLEKKSLN